MYVLKHKTTVNLPTAASVTHSRKAAHVNDVSSETTEYPSGLQDSERAFREKRGLRSPPWRAVTVSMNSTSP